MISKRLSIYCMPYFPYDWDDVLPKYEDLPIALTPSLSIEDVSAYFNPDKLQLGRSLSGERLDRIMATRIGLVDRYESSSDPNSEEDNEQSWRRLYLGVALLRLIKPMREIEFALQLAEEGPDAFREISCQFQYEPFEVVEVQKLNDITRADISEFRRLYPLLASAMSSEAWKFRIAAQFYDLGHVERCHWKSRYFLWMAGLDALVATEKKGHKEQRVVKERLIDLLGSNFPMYSDEEFPAYMQHRKPSLVLADVLDDLFDLRNDVIHGHRVETTVYSRPVRNSFNNDISHVEQLMENASRILRCSLLKALETSLTAFSSQTESEDYWASKGLVYQKLHKL